MANDVHDRGVAGEEAGEVGGRGVLGGRPVEDEEVGELAAEGGQDLVGEDQRDEPAPQQPPESSVRPRVVGDARALDRRLAAPAVGELGRVATLRRQHEPGERRLGDRRREQQLLRPTGHGDQPATEQAPGDGPDREAGHDPREAALDPGDVEEPAGLPADEHEAELDQDREQHEQRHGHPRAVAARGDEPGGADDGRGSAEDDDRDAARGRTAARCRATAPETTIPATPIAMYVTGSQAEP